MPLGRLPWHKELDIIDRTMRAISGIRDPEELVGAYWNGIGELLTVGDYVALSRRNVEAPYYLITRSSRFTEDINPWKERERLPRLKGGLLGELAYANAPVLIDDLPARLSPDDPAHFYLQGFSSLVALPQYENGESLNVTVMLCPPGQEMDRSIIPMLHWQSGLFGRGTSNLVLRNQLDEALTSLDRELQTVGEIQRSLLPGTLPAIEGFELAASYVTSARAGGDYYDFFPLAVNTATNKPAWGIFIADVSGHGTPAAVLMAITHAIAHTQPGTHAPPAALLQHLNQHLTRSYTRVGGFVTAFYAVLDTATRTLTYSAAGHNPPRLVRDGRILSLDNATVIPLGIMGDQPFEQATIQLEKGDLLLLYTDGITEAMPTPTAGARNREHLDLFGTDRLDRTLLEARNATPQECVNHILAEVAAFTANTPPTDDRTLIAIRCV